MPNAADATAGLAAPTAEACVEPCAEPCIEPGATDAAACAEVRAESLEASLPWALAAALRAYSREAATALGGLPGGPRGYHVLSAAAQTQSSAQQALGRLVGVDRSVMTYLVDDLVAAGLVERQPDPDDRRARRIVVTDAGLARLADLHDRVSAVDAHVLRGLAPVEQEAFRALLRRVACTAASDSADQPLDL